MSAKLILEDGKVFNGVFLQEPGENFVGEVVFNTSMSGYQEIFTDPSYSGQIITMTYPLIGNYGIHINDSEASKVQLNGLVIQELYDGPIHEHANTSLKDFLIENKIPTLMQVDCRALTKHIRSHGAMKGILTNKEISKEELDEYVKNFSMKEVVKNASSKTIAKTDKTQGVHVALVDYGYKKSIKDEMEKRGARVSVIPHTESFERLSELKPDGVLLSNGPGDPTDVSYSFELIKKIQENYPTFGICLGHQVLSLVNGAKTYKLPFGHRGANHSVLDLKTKKAYLSSQNHSYAVDPETMSGTDLKLRFENVNDKTVAGMEHETLPVFSVQFHPEANSGPEDTSFLFDEFLTMVMKNRTEELK